MEWVRVADVSQGFTEFASPALKSCTIRAYGYETNQTMGKKTESDVVITGEDYRLTINRNNAGTTRMPL